MCRTIAKIYAQAVFDIAVINDNVDQWKDTLSFFSKISKIDIIKSLFYRFLEPKKLSNIFISICEDCKNSSINHFSKNLIYVMSDNNRLVLLPMVYIEFNNLYQRYTSSVSVEIISARCLHHTQLMKIINMLSMRLSKKVYAVNKIDKSILGGIVIRINDYVIDGSIRSRILRLNHILQS